MSRKSKGTALASADEPPPSMELRGAHARSMFGRAPGDRVSMQVHGRLMNVGLDEWGDRRPRARIAIHRIAAARVKGRRAKR